MSLPGPRTPEIEVMLLLIRDYMVEEFGVSVEEAEGRICSEFGSFDLLDLDTQYYLGHEDELYWANTIMYEPGTLWWREGTHVIRRWP